MIDQSDTTDKIKKLLSDELSNIYDDLSSKYDRYVSQEDFNDPNEGIQEVIHNYWNISKSLIAEDLMHETQRQEKNKVGIPDIPTYKIRFAIEEGSWSVLLRDFLRTQMKDDFSRLLSLDELIWDTGASNQDDLTYYIIELDQITSKWVEPLFRFWKQHHDYGKVDDFAPLIIASYHSTSISMGEVMYEGGERLLKTKLKTLNDITYNEHSSSWNERAKTLVKEILSQEDENGNKTRKLFIITLSMFQKELMMKSQQSVKQESENDTENGFNWREFDPSNLEEREEFSEFLIRKLYRRDEEDPLDAAEAIISEILEKSDYSEIYIANYTKKFRDKINQITPAERIDAIQIELPKFLINIKSEEVSTKVKNESQQNINGLPIWDALIDNLSRVKRIDDEEVSKSIVSKAISSSYRILIDKKMDPLQSVNKITDIIRDNFDLSEKVEQELLDGITTLQEKIDKTKADLATVDDMVISSTSEMVHNIVKSNSL